MVIRLLEMSGEILHQFESDSINSHCIVEWRKRYFVYENSFQNALSETLVFQHKPVIFVDN